MNTSLWRNTEDEILKSAVMKYGLNQWSRVASLLHTKSAQQCKARWSMWLEPGIRKTQWYQVEDEKLLHLNKMMPAQWQTISSFFERTAEQCKARYEQLLDEEEAREGKTFSTSSKSSAQLCFNAEAKPARPDAVDMNEDELEMLAEARARLANTQGKKAKRKAREKVLNEAHRLARLQKQRELKAVCLYSRKKAKLSTAMNYNIEIPFEKMPAKGFYDTSIEEIESDSKEALEKNVKTSKPFNSLHRNTKKEAQVCFTHRETKRKISKLALPDPQQADKGDVRKILPENQSLMQGLRHLPLPKNDFEIVVPECEQEEIATMSSLEQLDSSVTAEKTFSQEDLRNAGALIMLEMLKLMESSEFPSLDISSDELKSAQHMLKAEIKLLRAEMGHQTLSESDYQQAWHECLQKLLYQQVNSSPPNDKSNVLALGMLRERYEENCKLVSEAAKRCVDLEGECRRKLRLHELLKKVQGFTTA